MRPRLRESGRLILKKCEVFTNTLAKPRTLWQYHATLWRVHGLILAPLAVENSDTPPQSTLWAITGGFGVNGAPAPSHIDSQ